jgi:hypothetical protein
MGAKDLGKLTEGRTYEIESVRQTTQESNLLLYVIEQNECLDSRSSRTGACLQGVLNEL